MIGGNPSLNCEHAKGDTALPASFSLSHEKKTQITDEPSKQEKKHTDRAQGTFPHSSQGA
jgi:hypothetical protein